VAKAPVATSKAEAHDIAHHGPGRYFLIWFLLLVATVTTVWTGRIDLGAANLPLALTIATVKATLVVLFFMHLSEAHGMTRLVFVISVFFAILLIVGVFGDLLTRYQPSLPSESPFPPEAETTPSRAH
jgi:cytochrome c oxidase subunit 4